jgi:hypothetical protein
VLFVVWYGCAEDDLVARHVADVYYPAQASFSWEHDAKRSVDTLVHLIADEYYVVASSRRPPAPKHNNWVINDKHLAAAMLTLCICVAVYSLYYANHM